MDFWTRRRIKDTSTGERWLIILEIVASSVDVMSSGSRRWGCSNVNNSDHCGSIEMSFLLLVLSLLSSLEEVNDDCCCICCVVGGGDREEDDEGTEETVVVFAVAALLLLLLLDLRFCDFLDCCWDDEEEDTAEDDFLLAPAALVPSEEEPSWWSLLCCRWDEVLLLGWLFSSWRRGWLIGPPLEDEAIGFDLQPPIIVKMLCSGDVIWFFWIKNAIRYLFLQLALSNWNQVPVKLFLRRLYWSDPAVVIGRPLSLRKL